MGGSYLFAEMLSVYYTGPADWVNVLEKRRYFNKTDNIYGHLLMLKYWFTLYPRIIGNERKVLKNKTKKLWHVLSFSYTYSFFCLFVLAVCVCGFFFPVLDFKKLELCVTSVVMMLKILDYNHKSIFFFIFGLPKKNCFFFLVANQ